MQAVILCGGKGTRLAGRTGEKPKGLVDVNGRPVLEWVLRGLERHGVKEMLLCTGYGAEQIEEAFGNGRALGLRLTYSTEKEPLGTAGAVKHAASQLSYPFLLVYGDVLHHINYADLIAFHRAKKGIGTLALHLSDHPEDSDLALLDEEQRITFFGRIAKPRAKLNLTNAGACVFEEAVVQAIPTGKSDFGLDIVPALVKAKEALYGFVTKAYVRDIGTAARLAAARSEWHDSE